jgi:FkbM family methyltransferase
MAPDRRTDPLSQGLPVFFRRFGWRASVTYALFRIKLLLGFPRPAKLKMKPRQAQYPLLIRLGASSDLDCFMEVFDAEEYRCLLDLASPRLILDLGANVGYSSAFFLSCFPEARVVAIEPDPDNFEVCRQNLAPYGDRVLLLLGAAWSHRCKLVLARGAREWGTQVFEKSEGVPTVEAWAVPSLMEMAGASEIDLLKVDVECSELRIFDENSAAWLPKVRNICVELHDPECEEVFRRAIQDFDCTLSAGSELTYCRNLRPKNAVGAGDR